MYPERKQRHTPNELLVLLHHLQSSNALRWPEWSLKRWQKLNSFAFQIILLFLCNRKQDDRNVRHAALSWVGGFTCLKFRCKRLNFQLSFAMIDIHSLQNFRFVGALNPIRTQPNDRCDVHKRGKLSHRDVCVWCMQVHHLFAIWPFLYDKAMIWHCRPHTHTSTSFFLVSVLLFICLFCFESCMLDDCARPLALQTSRKVHRCPAVHHTFCPSKRIFCSKWAALFHDRSAFSSLNTCELVLNCSAIIS